MQLKSVGEISTALKDVNDVLSKSTGTWIKYNETINDLKDISTKYSLESLKVVLTQTKLDEKQISAMLSAKGLRDEQLKETTAEILNAQAKKVNAEATEELTEKELGLKYAVGGLKDTIIKFATSTVGKLTIATTALALLGTKIYNLQKADEEALESSKEKLDELSSEYESVTSEVESLESQVSSLNNQIDELDPIANEDDIKNLEIEKGLLEAELAILKEKQAIAKQESHDSAVESLGTTTTSKYIAPTTNTQFIAGEVVTTTSFTEVTRQQELELAMQAYRDYEQQIEELNAKQKKLKESGKENSAEYRKNAESIKHLGTQMKDARSHANELAVGLQNEAKGLDTTTIEGEELSNSINETLDDYISFTDSLETNTDALNENTDAKQENANKSELLSFTDQISQVQSLSDGLDKLDKIYADVYDKGDFDWSSILNNEEFAETFSGFEEEYANFIFIFLYDKNTILQGGRMKTEEIITQELVRQKLIKRTESEKQTYIANQIGMPKQVLSAFKLGKKELWEEHLIALNKYLDNH